MNGPARGDAAPPKRGIFITFEGGEGTGKSTQARRLVEALRGLGVACVLTREPGGSPRAEALRAILLSGAVAALGPEAEALLFSAARIDHIDTLIAPALSRGNFVICDRFFDSTRAYQGVGGKVDSHLIAALERVAVGPCRPDLTIMLDVPAEVGLRRAAVRRQTDTVDRFEAEDVDYHRSLRAAFLDIARSDPARCVVINAANSPDDIAAEIWQTVERRFLDGSGTPNVARKQRKRGKKHERTRR